MPSESSRKVKFETTRLVLSELDLSDAEFLYRLMNQPEWYRFIGNRGIESLSRAEEYLRDVLIDSYARYGFGFYLIRRKEDDMKVGICGLVKRPTLDDIDIGYALLSDFTGNGYALEAATAVLSYARDDLGQQRIVAITNEDNERSIRLLEKLGLTFQRMVQLGNETEEIRLYGIDFEPMVTARP